MRAWANTEHQAVLPACTLRWHASWLLPGHAGPVGLWAQPRDLGLSPCSNPRGLRSSLMLALPRNPALLAPVRATHPSPLLRVHAGLPPPPPHSPKP
jgi:hypothetical protein